MHRTVIQNRNFEQVIYRIVCESYGLNEIALLHACNCHVRIISNHQCALFMRTILGQIKQNLEGCKFILVQFRCHLVGAQLEAANVDFFRNINTESDGICRRSICNFCMDICGTHSICFQNIGISGNNALVTGDVPLNLVCKFCGGNNQCHLLTHGQSYIFLRKVNGQFLFTSNADDMIIMFFETVTVGGDLFLRHQYFTVAFAVLTLC